MAGWATHHEWCVWQKPNPMPSLMKRHWTWNAELICYATRGKQIFNFPANGHALSVWSFNKVAKCDIHPTMKPVALVERAIRNSSKSRDIVLDPFGGSGTTMIAAERAGRRARLIELDPKYVDVIVQRWQVQTQREATLDGTGATFAQGALNASQA